jgi:hypothetical protein
MSSESFIFAHTLKARLRNATVEPVGILRYVVKGKIETETALASIEAQVSRNFQHVLNFPPVVWCHEPWMRSEPDWHNDKKSGMCWVLEEEWRDTLAVPVKHRRELIHGAVGWLITNVTSLISRHHYGEMTGRKKWAPEWDAWAHFGEGAKEYRRAKFK